MATTDVGRALTEEHRVAQARLRARTVDETVALMALLDVEDLARTTPRWIDANERLVRQLRRQSEDLALSYLVSLKYAEVGTREIPWTTTALDPARVRRSLTVTGPAVIRSLSAKGVPLGRALETATETAAGATSRHVLDGGRDGIYNTATADQAVVGFIRVTSGAPCAFCAALASRGPVYKSSGSFTVSNSRFSGDGDAKTHDHCACTFEPVYRQQGPWQTQFPEQARFEQMWSESQTWAREQGDLARGTSNDALNAFRRFYSRAA